MLEQALNQLGLNKHEIEVYLAILRAGKSAPARLSILTGINRTTIYSIGRKLAKLGLISFDNSGKTTYLMAQPPEAIESILSEESRALDEKRKLVEQIKEELLNLPKAQGYSVPRIKFVEENDLSDYMRNQNNVWEKSGQHYDNTWWGYHDNSYTEKYGEVIKWMWKVGSKDLKVRFLTNKADVETEMSKLFPERLTKVWAGQEFDTSLWAIGDFVIMAQTRVRPHYLVEINDPVLARNQRNLFAGIWEAGG
ncbi:MAG TPA: helix-turn-helix domain-containing protein [Candidatus Paceibacterota bacterium]